MPSSISGSDVRRAAWILLAGCLAVAFAVEAAARAGLDRASKIQRRMAAEYRLARTIGTGASTGRTHVLFVGNSLLDEDVRFDRLHDAVAPQWDARRRSNRTSSSRSELPTNKTCVRPVDAPV